MKTEKKRRPSCTKKGETAYLKTSCQNASEDMHREPMSGFQHAAECEAAGENCSQRVQPKLDGAWRPPAKQRQH